MEDERYRTFLGFVDASISGSGFCIAGSNKKYTIVPDVSYLRRSAETVVESQGDTTSVLFSREYEILAPMDGSFNKKIVCYVKTGAYNTNGANPNDTYKVKVSFLVNGKEVASEYGAAHSPNSTTEVTYLDIVVLDVNVREVRRGDKLSVKFDVEITEVDSTNPGLDVKLYCDPSVDDNALIVYFE